MSRRFGVELIAAGTALYARQAHQQGMLAAWDKLPTHIRDEYCLWAADVLRAVIKPRLEILSAGVSDAFTEETARPVREFWEGAIGAIITDTKPEAQAS